jgi:2-polyprenyl-6-methoxyphenol hydroxylase-like FAD-dependent oxidoreductase
VRLAAKVTGYENNGDGSVSALVSWAEGTQSLEVGSVLLAADGIHSAVRAQMHPGQPPINWGGAVMWRGTTLAKPIRTGSSFIGLGTHRQRMVVYPISHPDPQTGLATINWIAEVTMDNSSGWQQGGWFRPVKVDDFLHYFQDWTYDWLDVPGLLRQSDVVYENPMIDRDPVDTWRDGRVLLIGDAAHAMYPTGSNGASQAIIDARVLGALLIQHGVNEAALAAFDEKLCGPISQLVLRNRGAGPFGLLNIVNERCGGIFDDIDEVIPPTERDEFMARYKLAAGFARDQLNSAAPTIAPGLRAS